MEELFLRGTDLRLDPGVIRADVADFERLLDAGDLEAAVSLYQGPFLEGFFVNGAPEFERWCATHRTRLAERCAQALDRLAATADAEGNSGGAVDSRRRLAALDPLNTRVAMELVSSLAAHGDRAGALQHARIHGELLKQELGIEPDPALLALIDRIREEPSAALQLPTHVTGEERREPDAHTGAPPDTPAGPGTGGEGDVDVVAAPSLAPFAHHAGVPHSPVDVSGSTSISTRWWTRRRMGVVIGAVAGVAILGASIAVRLPSRRPPAVSGRVVVAPFRVASADQSLAYLREGMVELLSTKLGGDDATHAADPGSVLGAWRRAGAGDTVESDRTFALAVARGLGGERLLTGSVVGGPARVVINATIVDVADGMRRAQASVEGSPDSLLVLVDRLAARLLADETLAADRLSEQTTTSLAALRAYLDGQADFRRGHLQAASRHFRFAVDRDSTFALAALGLVQAAERIFDEPLRARALALAWANRAAMGERERLHLLALAGPRYPAESSERERLMAWEQAASALPDRADVWQGLGERLYHHGRRLEVPDALGRARSAFERAHELDPRFASPLPYLVLLSARSGDGRRARAYGDAYLGLGGDVELAHFVRWRVAHALDDSAALAKVRAELPRATVASLRAIAVVSLDEPLPLDEAAQAITARLARTVRSRERGELLRGRHALALAAGHPSEARMVLEELSAMRDEQAPSEVQPVLDALYGDGDTLIATRAVARIAMRDAPSPLTRCAAGQWHASRGAFALARAQSRELAVAGGTGTGPLATCTALIEAWVAVGERRPDARLALDRLDSLALAGSPLGELRPYLGLALARLYVQLGVPDRALASVRRRPFMRAWQAYLATYLRTEATLAAELGDRDGATRAWQHFLSLRTRPETPLADETERARRAVARVAGEGP